MGNNLLGVLISSIKSKFASIVSKLRLWLSWDYIRTRVIGRIRDFFVKLFDIKPKNKDDYYTIFGWMFSKKLAYLIIIVVGVISVWYIARTVTLFKKDAGGIPTYRYNSIMLRLAEKKVRIKAKSGYIAYEGVVKKGYVTGEGKLFSPDGIVLYTGNFEKNKYEGEGTQSYETGVLHYKGTFHENVYEGQGTLYREDGTKEYEGEFLNGLKEGNGKLYDNGGNTIYEGAFSTDDIVYGELLGKTPEEIRKSYFGSQILYEESEDIGADSVVQLKDIGALYLSHSDDGASDDSPKATTITVLSSRFKLGMLDAGNIEAVTRLLGTPIYEGYSSIIFPEAVAVNILNENHRALKGRVDMEYASEFSDDFVISWIDPNYTVYLHTYEKGGLVYTFISADNDDTFSFYEISEKGDE